MLLARGAARLLLLLARGAACFDASARARLEPASAMNLLLLALVAYVLVQLGIGVFISRRIRNENDYLLAGRSLGPVLTTASIFATWFGAETCVGAAAEVYSGGLRLSLSDPFGYALCLLVFGALLVVPLYRRGLTTLADLFRDRFSRCCTPCLPQEAPRACQNAHGMTLHGATERP